MELLTALAIGFVALLHCLFLILEMFLWRTRTGRRISGLDAEAASDTAKLAANQGLYNGFLASGLTWSIIAGSNAPELRIFFLVCVIVAGIFGSITVSRTIFLVQAMPGIVALVLVLIS
jgi:putative membrane protein